VSNRSSLEILAISLALSVSPHAHAADSHDLKARLSVAPSKAACVEFARRFHDFGEVRSVAFEANDPAIFVTWIEPRPGPKPVSFVFAYFLRENTWHLFADEVVTARSISVRTSEDGTRLIIASGDSELISRSLVNPTPLAAPDGR
jgi:hypothetical protein